MSERSKERRKRAKKLVKDMKEMYDNKYKEHPRTKELQLNPNQDDDKKISKGKQEAKNRNPRWKRYKDLAPEERDIPNEDVKSIKAENKRKIKKRLDKLKKKYPNMMKD